MDKRTANALKKSIKHWEENVAATSPKEVTLGLAHCALCHAFWVRTCKGCPIAEHTGHIGCADTPYEKAEKAFEALATNVYPKAFDAFTRAAQEELDFLRSLLPTNNED